MNIYKVSSEEYKDFYRDNNFIYFMKSCISKIKESYPNKKSRDYFTIASIIWKNTKNNENSEINMDLYPDEKKIKLIII